MNDLARPTPHCRFTHACVFSVNSHGYCAYHSQLIELALEQARSAVDYRVPGHLPPASSPAPARRDA